MDRPELPHTNSARTRKFSWVKKLMNKTDTPTPAVTAPTAPHTTLRAPPATHTQPLYEDDMVSCLSSISTNSTTLRATDHHYNQQRQFYTRNHNLPDTDNVSTNTAACHVTQPDRYSFNANNDTETNSSVKSLYSGNGRSVKHLSHTPNYISINSNLYSNNPSSSTHNASMINNVDVTSTLSDAKTDDNISTKPILSLSSDEDDVDVDDEADMNEIKSIRFQYDEYSQPLDSDINNTILRDDHQYSAFGADDDLEDDNSFDIKSRYPASSHGSTALTSMSILTSPLLTTINSQNTNHTNTNATAASVMTLASSSRHVPI